jgi:polyhydroxyalkanoate synthesis regulator phasin
MNDRRKWLVGSAVLLCGALFTGGSFALANTEATPPAVESRIAKAELTEGQKEVLGKLQTLRKAHMEKLQAETKAVVEQAVKDGTITQEQADRITQKRLHPKPGKGPHRGHGPKHGPGLKGEMRKKAPLTEEQFKQQLDARVTAGKLTQEQADQMLQRWREHQAKASNGQ